MNVICCCHFSNRDIHKCHRQFQLDFRLSHSSKVNVNWLAHNIHSQQQLYLWYIYTQTYIIDVMYCANTQTNVRKSSPAVWMALLLLPFAVYLLNDFWRKINKMNSISYQHMQIFNLNLSINTQNELYVFVLVVRLSKNLPIFKLCCCCRYCCYSSWYHSHFVRF